MTESTRKLSRFERRFLTVLALPAFGIALAYTVATTYAPVLITDALSPGVDGRIGPNPLAGGGSGALVTGIIIGGEGIFALTLPILIGAWSDRTNTRLGPRMPFVFAGAALAVIGLVLLVPFSESLIALAFAMGVFFIGYFVYDSPYYAMFPDLVPRNERGRSLGFAGTMRSVGLLVGLIAGAVLIGTVELLPFVIAAAALIGVTAALYFRGRSLFPRPRYSATGTGAGAWRVELDLVRRHPNIRRWSIANVCWEGAVASLKVYVVLYFTEGLGLSFYQTAGALAMVGIAAVFAAPISGILADRYGNRPVMLVATWCFALGLVIPAVSDYKPFLIATAVVAFFAVMLITLPYAMLMGMLPEYEEHGAGAGLFGLSRGVGVLIGPLAAGIAIHFLDSVDVLAFADTEGYAAAFGVSTLLLLASIPLLRNIREQRGDASPSGA